MYDVKKEDVLRTIPGSDAPAMYTDLSGFWRKYLDIPYCEDSPAQKLNLVLPNEGEGPFPLIVFIHGGGWLTGDKDEIPSQSANRLVYAGYAVSSVNYRLSDEAKWPAPLYDCKAAVRFLRAHAKEYHLDTQRIGAFGNSAGGHYVGLMGTTNDNPHFEDLSMGNAEYSSAVQAVCCWYGVFDFVHWVEDWKEAYPDRTFDDTVSAEAYLFGHSIREHPERLRDASSVLRIGPDAPPFFVEAGTHDSAVPCRQSQRFYDRYAEVCGKDTISLRLLEGAEHADPMFKTDENLFEVVKFFDRYIRQIPEREFFPLPNLAAVPTKPNAH